MLDGTVTLKHQRSLAETEEPSNEEGIACRFAETCFFASIGCLVLPPLLTLFLRNGRSTMSTALTREEILERVKQRKDHFGPILKEHMNLQRITTDSVNEAITEIAASAVSAFIDLAYRDE